MTSRSPLEPAFESTGYTNELAFRRAVNDLLIFHGWRPVVKNQGFADVLAEKDNRFLMMELKIPKLSAHVDTALGQLMRYSVDGPQPCKLIIVFEGDWADGARKQAARVIEKFDLPIVATTAKRFVEFVENGGDPFEFTVC